MIHVTETFTCTLFKVRINLCHFVSIISLEESFDKFVTQKRRFFLTEQFLQGNIPLRSLLDEETIYLFPPMKADERAILSRQFRWNFEKKNFFWFTVFGLKISIPLRDNCFKDFHVKTDERNILTQFCCSN